ncbi:MAG TPA: HNH endonuclease signature motif containing protein [Streptosporangiaceae bacterium]
MAASVCDDDHTIPFDQGGRTCQCNLGPLCRRHHRVKQARGWRLEQPEPGVFTWTMPSGRVYTTGPTEHIA